MKSNQAKRVSYIYSKFTSGHTKNILQVVFSTINSERSGTFAVGNFSQIKNNCERLGPENDHGRSKEVLNVRNLKLIALLVVSHIIYLDHFKGSCKTSLTYNFLIDLLSIFYK